MFKYVLRATAALVAMGLAGSAANAGAGFSTFQVTDPQGAPIEAAAWYPTDATPARMSLGLADQTVAAGAKVQGKDLPLIIMSHGNGGFFGSHSDTAVALAEAGFVVAALTHGGDSYADQSRATDVANRPRQLRLLLDHMLSTSALRTAVDPRRVGVFGFSAGGMTALAALGGTLDRSRMTEHCRTGDFYDCRLARTHAVPPSEWNSWSPDVRIKAAVIAAPALGFAFQESSLRKIRVPVQLWQAGQDRILPAPIYVEPVRANLGRAPEFKRVQGAGHFDFLAPCSEGGMRSVPQICTSNAPFDRARFHADFNLDVVRFFRAQLGKQ